jgi:hypothetical protein
MAIADSEQNFEQNPNQNDEQDNLSDIELDDAEIQDDAPSYGTGVREIPGYAMSSDRRRNLYDRNHEHNEDSATLTGGDVDANYEQAAMEGDESVGGTAPTPDMDIVDELGRAVGIELDDANFLHTSEMLEQRDDRRWELEPVSSEDYEERRELDD